LLKCVVASGLQPNQRLFVKRLLNREGFIASRRQNPNFAQRFIWATPRMDYVIYDPNDIAQLNAFSSKWQANKLQWSVCDELSIL